MKRLVLLIASISLCLTFLSSCNNNNLEKDNTTTLKTTDSGSEPEATALINPDDIILNSNTSKSEWDLVDDDYRLSWSEQYLYIWLLAGYSALELIPEEIVAGIDEYFQNNPAATPEQATKSVGDGYGFIDKENKWYANVKHNKPEPKDEQLDKDEQSNAMNKDEQSNTTKLDISFRFKKYLKDNDIIAELDNYDVQYDRYGSLDKVFAFSGTAELDDYYNYGWYDDEQYYFCIFVTPHGGSYSDSWYIYCDRNSFPNFFEDLKAYGIIDVELACYIPSYKYESNQGNMANLRAVQY